MHNTAHQLAEQFPHALQRMEQSRDVEELVAFFTADAKFSKLGATNGQQESEGASQFWQTYLKQFSEIHSEFTHLHMSERAVVLEWVSEGAHADGRAISYRGVSILVFDTSAKITNFRTYYDSAAFMEKTGIMGTENETAANFSHQQHGR